MRLPAGPLAAALIAPLAALGALLLVVPHRFEPLPLGPLVSYLPLVGTAFVVLSALLPWLWLRRAGEVSLRARLALALCTAAGLPLVFGAAVSARQQERAVIIAVTRLHEVVASDRAAALAQTIDAFQRAGSTIGR